MDIALVILLAAIGGVVVGAVIGTVDLYRRGEFSKRRAGPSPPTE